MSSESDDLIQGVAWRQWCDRLKAVGDGILESDDPDDGQSRAEGYRSLTRLLAAAMEFELEAGDPAYPDFLRDHGSRSQWGGANPDVVTLRAAIDPELTYKIWADVDGMFQATFCQHDGAVERATIAADQERHLESFEVDEDGFLEINLSPDPHPENWIPTHPDAQIFEIQIFVSDWECHTAPTFHIERIDDAGDGVAPVRKSASDIERGLERSMEWLENASTYWNRHARQLAEKFPNNVPSQLGQDPGDPGVLATGRCHWNLADDEALLITCEVPLAQYWSFAIQTLTWFESGDFARRQTSLTGDQIHLDEDGLARLVLCEKDCGAPNWIDTEGRRSGLLVYRYGWAETWPTPSVRCVKLDELDDLLPEDHPALTQEERREQLSLRREALWNRLA
ncbi:MAG TPA: hypothetical protein EYG08_04805 [Myxococcales bacterium]|nr:hypothetical protein [Myxococcales bacterium]